MAWKIEFTPRAEKSLNKLDQSTATRILKFLHGRVATSENPYDLAKALQGPENENMLRFRVGDYRILSRIERDIVTVFVVAVGHRREIYR